MKSIFILFLVSIAIICNESIALQLSADGTYYVSGDPDLAGNYVDDQGNIIDASGARLIDNIFKGGKNGGKNGKEGTTTPTFGGKKTKAPKSGKSVGKKGTTTPTFGGKKTKAPKGGKSVGKKGTTTPIFGGKKTKAPKGGKSVGKKTKGYKGGKSGKGKKGATTPTSSPTNKKVFPIIFPNPLPDIAEPANDRAFIFPTDGARSNSLD